MSVIHFDVEVHGKESKPMYVVKVHHPGVVGIYYTGRDRNRNKAFCIAMQKLMDSLPKGEEKEKP